VTWRHPDFCLEPWLTPEEERLIDLLDDVWNGKALAKGDEALEELLEEEFLRELDLDLDDPDFTDLAAEGLEGNEDGNYDDERERAGDADPSYWDLLEWDEEPEENDDPLDEDDLDEDEFDEDDLEYVDDWT
jgi:hypothetical protein